MWRPKGELPEIVGEEVEDVFDHLHFKSCLRDYTEDLVHGRRTLEGVLADGEECSRVADELEFLGSDPLMIEKARMRAQAAKQAVEKFR